MRGYMAAGPATASSYFTAKAHPAPAMLPYEPRDAEWAASQAAAVWRAAWWIGIWWSFGTILATFPTVWTLLSGGWGESHLAELRFGASAAILTALQCAGAVALAGALLTNACRRIIAIVASLMSLLLLLAVVNGILLGGVYFERSFHLVWLGAVVVRMLLSGGIMVVAMVAWWPGWLTRTRLFGAVSILLLGYPAGQLLDLTYWWLARGEPVREVMREQFSWQGWPHMLQAGLLLLASTLLFVVSNTRRKGRSLLWVAVLVAMLGIALADLMYLHQTFDTFWNYQPLSQLLSMIAHILRGAAPVIGLLALRLMRTTGM